MIHLGIDFDNTLVCYDGVFAETACEQKLISSSERTLSKDALRNRLRAEGREEDWTKLQGYVYGPGMSRAKPFPGALEFLAACRERGIAVCVISHRTAKPFLGPAYDLLSAARQWLDANGFFAKTGIAQEHAHFELTKQSKLARIALESCTHFIDDLPEFLAEPAFPGGVERILLDPANQHPDDPRWQRAASWLELGKRLLPHAENA